MDTSKKAGWMRNDKEKFSWSRNIFELTPIAQSRFHKAEIKFQSLCRPLKLFISDYFWHLCSSRLPQTEERNINYIISPFNVIGFGRSRTCVCGRGAIKHIKSFFLSCEAPCVTQDRKQKEKRSAI